MKNLRKIIALFAFIFLAGIFITVITINSSLNKTEIKNETVETQKETLYLLKAENKTI
jgi:preprotein translocase subunit SecG